MKEQPEQPQSQRDRKAFGLYRSRWLMFPLVLFILLETGWQLWEQHSKWPQLLGGFNIAHVSDFGSLEWLIFRTVVFSYILATLLFQWARFKAQNNVVLEQPSVTDDSIWPPPPCKPS